MKSKSILACLLAAVLLFTACSPSATPATDTPTEGAATDAAVTDAPAAQTGNDDSTFIVGFDANFPPYGYKEGDDYVGFDLDLAAEVANRNGWTLVKQPIDWDAKDMELNSGTIDCIWNGFTINGREDKYAWTKPYVDNSQVFVVKAEDGIKEHADLAGKVVDVQADSSALTALQDDKMKDLRESFQTLEQVPDYNIGFMNLESGIAQAVAMDIGVAHYQIESRTAGAFVILEQPIVTEQYGVGFKLGNEALRDQVEQTLDAMREDGTFAKIAEKWGLTDAIITQ